jgi:hypothetical protein
MKLVESDPQLEAIIVDDKLRAYVSSGLKPRVALSPIGAASLPGSAPTPRAPP